MMLFVNQPALQPNGLVNMHLLDTRGGRIELARRAKGLSQTEFRQLLLKEKKIEVGSAHWSRVESDKVGLSLPLLEAICELLDESSDWILFGKGKNGGGNGHDIGISEDASELARIADELDTDYRAWLMEEARRIHAANQERREAAQREAALHAAISVVSSAAPGRGGKSDRV